jgi:hypothetical protein
VQVNLRRTSGFIFALPFLGAEYLTPEYLNSLEIANQTPYVSVHQKQELSVTESTPPRKPGRPKGSSRLNQTDALLCRQVAEEVLQNASLTNRAAILKVIGSQNPAGLRRLQGKFHRDEIVAAAKARAVAAEQARQATAQPNLEQMRLALDFACGGPSFQQAMRAMAATPFMQNIERMRREGVFEQAWMNVQQSPFMQTFAALQKAGWLGLPGQDNRNARPKE